MRNIPAVKFMVHDNYNFIRFLFKFNFFWHVSSLGFCLFKLWCMKLTILLNFFIKVCSHQKKRMQKSMHSFLERALHFAHREVLLHTLGECHYISEFVTSSSRCAEKRSKNNQWKISNIKEKIRFRFRSVWMGPKFSRLSWLQWGCWLSLWHLEIYWTFFPRNHLRLLSVLSVFIQCNEQPLIPLFRTSGDVFSGFKSHSGQPYSLRFTSGATPLYMASVYGQHSSRSLSPHACFSRGGMQDLIGRPPAYRTVSQKLLETVISDISVYTK